MGKFRAAILFVLLLYAGYAGAMYAMQASILFPIASKDHHVFGPAPPGAQWVEVPVAFGNARAVYWPARDQAKSAGAIWYAHGNGETVENWFGLVQPLLEHGFAVMQFDIPVMAAPTAARISTRSTRPRTPPGIGLPGSPASIPSG